MKYLIMIKNEKLKTFRVILNDKGVLFELDDLSNLKAVVSSDLYHPDNVISYLGGSI